MRLIVGALLASVVTLCCGFGIFAAFRVNHDPLSRLPADTVALQLVANETAGPPPAWRAPVVPRIEAIENVSAVRMDRVMTDAPTLLPISRVTIQPSSLPIATVSPAAVIGASQQRVPSPRESQPTGLSATAALSAPAMATALIANVSDQTAPSPPIATVSAPSNSSAGTAPMQQALAAETHPAQPAANAKPDAIGKTGEPITAAIPTVAAVEPALNSASPASSPINITGTPPKVAVPEPKARPKLAARRTSRKAVRQALERRRLAARKRIALKTAASNATQTDFQNATFRNPFFQSAPNAFQHQPATNSVAQKSSNAAGSNGAGNPVGWPSAQ